MGNRLFNEDAKVTQVFGRGDLVYMQAGYGFDVNKNCLGKCDDQGVLKKPAAKPAAQASKTATKTTEKASESKTTETTEDNAKASSDADNTKPDAGQGNAGGGEGSGDETGGTGSGDSKDVEATDAAVKLASENDIDLAGVEGTGAEGKIVKADVEKVIAAKEE